MYCTITHHHWRRRRDNMCASKEPVWQHRTSRRTIKSIDHHQTVAGCKCIGATVNDVPLVILRGSWHATLAVDDESRLVSRVAGTTTTSCAAACTIQVIGHDIDDRFLSRLTQFCHALYNYATLSVFTWLGMRNSWPNAAVMSRLHDFALSWAYGMGSLSLRKFF